MDRLHLFDACGIELEYMLVDRRTLDVRPAADQLLAKLCGGTVSSDFEDGPATWSNELAAHVIELKTTDPAKDIRAVPAQLVAAIKKVQPALADLGLRLLPTAMHPWMNPAEAQLWPHEFHEIYETYDRIFNCRTHGWANVQSVHLNLPFSGDEEFARLHAAVRLVLPLLPALAASSPLVDGQLTGVLDNRMQHYAAHCLALPFLTGDIIPEPFYDEATYRREIFVRLDQTISGHDHEHRLQHEFLNARGAIARFDRGSIEIRVMDVQEHPAADVAICAAVIALLKHLVAENWSSLESQQQFSTLRLRAILDAVTIHAEHTLIDDREFLGHFHYPGHACRAGELWQHVVGHIRSDADLAALISPLDVILDQGTLATRLQAALGEDFTPRQLFQIYQLLTECLDGGVSFAN